MTTYSQLSDLQNYLKSKVGLNCHIGMIDVSANELPCILIIPDEGGIITPPLHSQLTTFDFNIKIQLIDGRELARLIKTLSYFDKLMTNINDFQSNEGHVMQSDYNTEYEENNFVITCRYTLKVRLQKV